MAGWNSIRVAAAALLVAALMPMRATAQPARAAECVARSPAAAEAVKRRASIALYYELKLALAGGRVYEWRGDAAARMVMSDASHVAVNAGHGHAIDADNRVVRWAAGSNGIEVVLEDAAFVAVGESGMLAIRCDGGLWQRKAGARDWARVADAAVHAWVGDSADYFIDPNGVLFVTGLAHRGQYGNDRLEEARGWLAVADNAVSVYSHTGHAVFLRRDGAVLGSGGNRFGPLGTHGYGDKATRWGVIFEGASHLGTGSRHSMAIRADGKLWTWGAADGLKARQVLTGVAAATGGDHETLAIRNDGTVWNWPVGRPPKPVDLPR